MQNKPLGSASLSLISKCEINERVGADVNLICVSETKSPKRISIHWDDMTGYRLNIIMEAILSVGDGL